MVSHQIGIWLERVSLILGFLSFWLAAPELLGVHRLAKLENFLESCLKRLPIIIYISLFAGVIAGAVISIPFAPYMPKFHEGQESKWPTLLGSGAILIIAIIFALLVLMFRGILERSVHWIISHLENDARLRERCLVFGAALFILSFVLQFIATYFD